MTDEKPKSPWDSGNQNNPMETIAAASALGMTLATQAFGLWLSVLSGVTRAGEEIAAKPKAKDEPKAFEPGSSSEAEKAKAAARTVVADIERTMRDVAEVAGKLAAPPTPAPVKAKAVPKAKVAEKPVQEAKSAPEAEPSPAAKVVSETKSAPEAEPAATEAQAPKIVRTAATAPGELFSGDAKPVSKKSKAAPKKAATPAPENPVVKAEPVKVAKAEPVKLEVSAPAVEPVTRTPASDRKIMPEDFRQPKAIDKPDEPDDLKLIEGVGPKLEKVLNGLGIWSFAQIGQLEAEEIAWLDDYLGLSGRFDRDNWAGQARTFGKAA